MVAVFITFLGLCFGSFVNALVWRLHEQEISSTADKSTEINTDLSILKGRSMCPNCHHELAAKDLVPLFSWLWLRGRCRYCKAPISIQYPLVEVLTALLFLASYYYWPFLLQGTGLFTFVLWLPILTGFVALAVYDLTWFLLPNRIVFPLIGLSLIHLMGLIIFYHAKWDVLLGAMFGVLVISGLFYVLFMVSHGRWIGGGDVKLGIVLGILAGSLTHALLVLFLSSLLGTVAALPLVAQGKANRKTALPYGPFLIIATIITVLWGSEIVNWYTRVLNVG